MSSRVFARAINLELRASRRLTLLLATAHATACASVWLLSWAWPWRALLASVIAASAWRVIRTHGLRVGRRAIVNLQWRQGETWLLLLAGGDACEARLQADSYLHRHLLILNFRGLQDWRQLSCLLTADSLAIDDFRRLRVLARWHFGKAGE